MLKIELNDYGFDDTLKEVIDYLNLAIKSNFKKQKNETISKALGMIETLYYIVKVTEVDSEGYQAEAVNNELKEN